MAKGSSFSSSKAEDICICVFSFWNNGTEKRIGPGSQKPWIVPIPGTTNPQHLDDFLQAANVRLTTGELAEFEKDYAQIKLVGHRADPFTESQIDK